MSSTTTPSGFTPLRQARVAAALNDDWARLLADAGSQARAAAWPALPGAAGPDLASVLAAVGGDPAFGLDEGDANLARLVALAGTDELAARVVLQRLVPGLVQAARRHRHVGVRAAFDELVGAAWVLVRTYPIERRPRRIASNLCRDAAYEAFVRPRRLRAADEEPRGGLREEILSPSAAARPNARRGAPVSTRGVMRCAFPVVDDEVRALLLDARRAGMPTAQLALVMELHVLGRHPRTLAARLRVSERTVRDRRDAALARLARLERAAA